jgi:hypothetical protein
VEHRYIIKVRQGKAIRLRNANTREDLLLKFRDEYISSIGAGFVVNFCPTGEGMPSDRRESLITLFDGEETLMPAYLGGTCSDIDRLVKELRS